MKQGIPVLGNAMRFVVALTTFALWAGSTHAIIIRDDVDDARYRALGAKYPMVGDLGGVACVLIGDRWILTAAHVGLQDVQSPYRSAAVKFGKRSYPVERIYLHHDYEPDAGLANGADIALVKLAQPVLGIWPAKLYTGSDEVGRTVVLVGRGTTGNGKTGSIENSEGVLRGATNKIDVAQKNALVMRFDEPKDATPLEGISGFGDSGGPALLEKDGAIYVLGISSNNSGKPGVCVYGSDDRYARISTTANWITEMQRVEPPSMFDWMKIQPVSDGIATDFGAPHKEAIPKFFKAYNSHDAGQIKGFSEEFWPHKKGPEGAVKALESVFGQYGPLDMRSFSIRNDGEVDVLVLCEKLKELRRLRFRKALNPQQIGNIAIREVTD